MHNIPSKYYFKHITSPGKMITRLNNIASTIFFAFIGASFIASPVLGIEQYPNKPVTLIIPFSAGGSHDINARVLTSVIPTYLGQPMLVKLMPGGGGQRGISEAISAKADGYTLLFGHNFLDQLQPIVSKLNYDPLSKLETVWKVNDSVSVIYVRADSPFRSIEELVAHVKDKPNELVYPHSGKWGFSFIVGTLLFTAEEMEVRYVPYKGGGPVKASILAGDGDFASAPFSSVKELYQTGKIRILAVAGPNRLTDLPDIKSFAELAYPSSGIAMERIVMAPLGTPVERIEILRGAFADLYKDKRFLRLMHQLGENLNYMDGSEYEQIRLSQRREYQQLVKRLLQD